MKPPGNTTLISASAGSGKTYQLAGRFLRILLEPGPDHGRTDPTTVLATTFTRAAAGEILSRVLSWLARAVLDPEKRRELGGVPGASREPTDKECAEVLRLVTERIHRLQIGTMDGIFARVARSFGPSVGLPPSWTVAMPEQAARMAESCVDGLLAGPEGEAMRKAWRQFKGKAPALGFRAQLMETFEELRLDLRDIPREQARAEGTGPRRMTAEVTTALRDFLVGFAPPRTRNWPGNVEKMRRLLDSPPLLLNFLDLTPCRKLALGEKEFDRAGIPEDFIRVFGPVMREAVEDLRRLYRLRESALLDLAERYDRARSAQSYLSGGYTFREVEAAALQVALGMGSEELYFRLDGRISHLLLDEFQDTSRRQFSFFDPVLRETVSKGGHVLVVGDRKQSIYGWRGSDPRLMKDVEKVLPGAEPVRLSESFRSSRAVLAAVDRVFGSLEDSGLFEKKPELIRAVAEWNRDYPAHVSSRSAAGQPGRVVLFVRPGDTSADVRAAVLRKVVERAKAHVDSTHGSLGILCRTHALIPGILAGLKRHGIEASGEGGNPLTDSAAVEMILSLLSWADHPGHTAGRYHVCAGGMAEVFGCGKVPAWGGEDQEALAFLKELRRDFADRGLAEVLSGWVGDERWRAAVTAHDRMRCGQLVELARAFDQAGGGRLAEFVRRVRTERVENPRTAQVRVMTVHGAKGLEFDRVIVADLDRGVNAGGRDQVKIRIREGRARILPGERDGELLGVAPLLAEVKGEEFLEALSVLYVALTRARRDLEVVVGKKPSRESLSLGKIVRSQWGWPEGEKEGEMEVALAEAEKFEEPKKAALPVDPGIGVTPGRAPAEPVARLGLESPSAREGGGKVRLAHVISQGSGQALDRGTRIHAWLSRVEWLAGGLADPVRWVDEAPELWRGMDRKEVEREAREVAGRMESGMGWVFDRKGWEKKWSGAIRLEVWREKSFAVVWKREGAPEVLTGTFDRVVVARDGAGRPVGAEVVDFKTDRLAGEKERKEREEFYRPQLEAYAGAVAKLTGLPPDRVTTRIAWVWSEK